MNQVFIGTTLVKLDRIDSTNTFLLDLLRNQKVPEGFVVWADDQYAGRGQQGNDWVSEKGVNLTFSLFIKPSFIDISDQFYISKMVSLAIQAFLASMGIASKVKWPNDIYVGDKKIGGILIENSVKGSRLDRTVIGIGLNVNQKLFPTDLKAKASSLLLLTEKEWDREDLLKQLCKFLEVEYLKLRAGKREALDQAYIDGLYRFGERHPFSDGNENFYGEIIGVDPKGKLLLKKDSEAICVYDFKEIQFVI